MPDLRRKFYGESSTDDIIRKLLIAHNIARQNNEDASDTARSQYDLKAAPHKFLPQQLVLMDEHSFLHKNQKLAPKWSGPHKVIRLKGEANVEIQLRHNNKKVVVHCNRLKPYFVPIKNSAIHPDVLDSPPPIRDAPQIVPDPPTPTDNQQILLPPIVEVTHTAPSPAIIQPSQTKSPRRRARNSSTSSSSSVAQSNLPDDAPPAMHTCARTHSSASSPPTLAKQRIFMPQVTFEPLPIFQ